MDFDAIEKKLKEGIAVATLHPGRYGGRYVGRRYNKFKQETEKLVLDDDNPMK